MDPIIIDPKVALGSIAGIVTTTIAIVHVIKRQLGDVPYLSRLPVAVYAWLIAFALTWLAHSVLHTIEGELAVLLAQSVISTILAAGAIEIFRNGSKPISDTRVAREARIRRRRDDDEGL